MPTAYERDDRRQLITVTVTEPYSVDDIFGVIDRQAAEDTWGYAMLYDLRAVTQAPTEADLSRIAARFMVAGGGRAPGPVGISIGVRPALFRLGLLCAELTKELLTVEMLLTARQFADWLARNAGVRRVPPKQP